EDALHQRAEIPLWHDLLSAGLAVGLTLELNRRSSGWVMPILGLLFSAYVLGLGRWFEGGLYFRGFSLTRYLYRMYFTDEGLFGTIASISSTYVFIFVLFAAFLQVSGASKFILRVAQRLLGKVTGGPGLMAVMASGLMGTISGSAIANTVATGSITIPLMKKVGFKPTFAAAVETAASTGGQLIPPIMGAGAFIMAEWTGLPYSTIVQVAFLPALLYFASVGFHVYLEAKKNGLQPVTQAEDQTSWPDIWREGLHFILPFTLLVVLLILGYTPTLAAGLGTLAVVLTSQLTRQHRMGWRDILASLEAGSRNMVVTGLLLVAAGLIVGCLAMSGLSISFSQLLLGWSGGSIWLALGLVALASLVLGMGLPVTAAYLMLAILAAPTLEQLGLPLLSAHLIIFWLSQDANVTPPVCLAAFAAAGIAGASPLKTGLQSWKIAKGMYVIPLLFAFTPLLEGDLAARCLTFFFALPGLLGLTTLLSGYWFGTLSWTGRALGAGLGLACLFPSLYLQVSGLIALLVWGWWRSRRHTSAQG
ncbi:MAG: TRAP transporter fused permease subunit, partial [Bacteroidota bacterium]